MAASSGEAETGPMPDASARIWVILGGLLLMAVVILALRWTFGTDRKVPTARLADPDDPTAFGLLEEALATRADAIRAERPPSLMRLISWARENGVLQSDEYERFRQWVGLRNRAVHTSEPIALDAAAHALDDIEGLLARLN